MHHISNLFQCKILSSDTSSTKKLFSMPTSTFAVVFICLTVRFKNHSIGSRNRQPQKYHENVTELFEENAPKNPTNLYEMQISDIMGRYLVATRDIRPGEIIIEEKPLVIGPPIESGPICLSCLKELPSLESDFSCPACFWPLCKKDCLGNGHNQTECDIFAKKKVFDIVKKVNQQDLKATFGIIFQLRCLFLKLCDSKKWKQLMEMESHNELRKNIKWLWNRNQTQIVDRIRNDLQIDDFTEEEIHTVCGIIEVNCFEIGVEGARGRALYPTAYLLAHDCSPNSTHIDNPVDFTLSICTMQNLKQGESLTVNYGYILMGTLKRRERLHTGKFFWCNCRRCSDVTELGTYCSALKCQLCVTGLVLPMNPLDQEAKWSCQKCTHCIDAKSVSVYLDKLFNELDAIDPMDVLSQEKFIEKYEGSLVENHYLILSAKYPLCQLYGRAKDFLIGSLSEDLLSRKEKYCRDLLKVVSALEPGLSRTKGIIMYELHVPLLLLARRRLENKRIDKKVFLKTLKEVIRLLEESKQILKMEFGKNEQEMVHGAEVALMSLKFQSIL